MNFRANLTCLFLNGLIVEMAESQTPQDAIPLDPKAPATGQEAWERNNLDMLPTANLKVNTEADAKAALDKASQNRGVVKWIQQRFFGRGSAEYFRAKVDAKIGSSSSTPSDLELPPMHEPGNFEAWRAKQGTSSNLALGQANRLDEASRVAGFRGNGAPRMTPPTAEGLARAQDAVASTPPTPPAEPSQGK